MTRLLVLLVAFAVATRAPARAADAKGPNVLFLFADDQREDTIAALGNPHIKTPNLDRLVKRGLAFDRAYMQGAFQGATCVPSRAMLLSGQSLFRVDEKLLRDETWPEAFGKAGYTTFISGKWHNGEKSLVRSFQEARGIFSGGMTNPLKANLADLADGKLGTPKLAPKHACAVFADEAIGFLNRKHDRPFFCYVPFDAPHDPHVVPDDFPVRYDPDKLPLPANVLPQHPFNNGEMTIRDEALLGWPRDPKKVREMLAEYYRYVSYLDAEIGRVLDALEKSPHADTTIVVFTADSGVARGSHGLIGKQNLYEHSVRVPLVIAGPGVPEGKRTAAMCYLFDVLPTLGKLCGVPAPAASEGREFTATLADPGRAARTNLVFAYRNVQRAVRDDRWKLIRYPQVDRTQLFDLTADPDEVTDLAGKPEHAAKVKDLLALLEAEQKRYGDKTPSRSRSPSRPSGCRPRRGRSRSRTRLPPHFPAALAEGDPGRNHTGQRKRRAMRRFSTCTVLWLAVVGTAPAADDRTGRDKVLADAESRLKAIYENRDFAPATFPGRWLADSSGYLMLEPLKPGAEPEVVKYDVKTGKRSVLAGADQLVSPGSKQRLFVQRCFQTPVEHTFCLETRTGIWLFDTKSGELHKLPDEVPSGLSAGSFSPRVDRVVVRRGRNLAVVDVATGRVTLLTTDDDRGRLDNYAPSWSPDGRRVAYVQSDSTKVRTRPVLRPTDPTYPEVANVPFARVGTPIPTLRVGVVDREGGATRWLKLPAEPGTCYINDVGWAGNSKELLIELLSRSRDSRKFLLTNAETGEVATAYEETDPAWVDASYSANAGLEWVRGGKEFVLLSERDGWRQAHVISRDGKQRTLLTNDRSDIIARGPVDEPGGWFYYLASPTNATQRYLYRIRLDGTGDPERVTPADQPGTHSYEFSPDRKWAFHTYSTFDKPPVIDLVRLSDHHSERVLEASEDVRTRAAPLITRPTEFLKLDIGSGVVMDAWLIKPRDFDEKKKYPLFVFVYGEPHGQTVLDDWAGGQNHTMFHRTIADLGYLVVSMDGRGTPAPKGAAWRRAVYGSLGPLSTEEQAAGVKELGRTRPYVDLSRVGIWGWSGGGSNTLNALFRRPDVYHVGIAVAPKPRPELYNAWFQEIFMRTPDVNPDGYRTAAAINFAEGLKGDLLIVHGTGETNTHLQITESLVDRLIELGKRFDYMAYPNRDHGLREGKGTAVHLRMLMTRYLIDHLPPGPR